MREFLPLVLFLGACNDQEVHRASTTDEFDQAPSNMVDILWVIDNSVSMLNEQAGVAEGAADFVANLETTDMDFHLGVVSTDVDLSNTTAGVLLGTPPVLENGCLLDEDLTNDGTCSGYADAFRTRIQQGNSGSDQEKGLQAAIMALSAPLSYGANAGFLRDGAMLSIIVLSDENDCSDFGALGADSTGEDCYLRARELTPVPDLVRMLSDIKGEDQVVVSGIVGPEIVDNCEATVPGRRYFTAIEILGGVQADICQTDYSAVMDRLGLQASGILTIFQLTHAAVDDGTIEVTVTPPDGDPTIVPQDEVNGWTYLADYAQIEFHGTAVPERGAHIEVSYEIAGAVPAAPSDTGG